MRPKDAEVLREIAKHCANNGQDRWTGVLLRLAGTPPKVLNPVISPNITAMTTKLVLEALPISRVEQWRWEQLELEACSVLGLAANLCPKFCKDLRDALTQRSGKHEYEVWAVEGVFVKWWREQEAVL